MSVIELTEAMDEQALRTIQLFRERLAELERNWTDLESEGFTVLGWVGHNSECKLNTTGTSVNVHRLKGLYIDFRFFWGNDEPSNFYTIQKLIGKHCREVGSVKKALKYNNQQWKRAGTGKKWHGLDTDEMINVIFYGSIIHQVEDKQPALQSVKSILSQTAVHHLLAITIRERMFPLRSLEQMLSPLTKDRQVVQVPDCFA
tara:strand:+ start:1180 stop:1785 length:606 start_codon:yes stop_codon:yes gene_type:complete